MKITDEKPCPHMGRLLDHEAEGTAPGWIRWYILAHVARCGPCKRVLLSLRTILKELKVLASPSLAESLLRLSSNQRHIAPFGGGKGRSPWGSEAGEELSRPVFENIAFPRDQFSPSESLS